MLACKFANAERSCWLGANNFKSFDSSTVSQNVKWLKFKVFLSLQSGFPLRVPHQTLEKTPSLVGFTPLECASSSSPGFHLEARERNKFELKVMLPWIGLKATSSLCSFHTLQAEKFQPLQQFKFQVSWCYVDASCIMRLLTFKTLLRKIAHIT